MESDLTRLPLAAAVASSLLAAAPPIAHDLKSMRKDGLAPTFDILSAEVRTKLDLSGKIMESK